VAEGLSIDSEFSMYIEYILCRLGIKNLRFADDGDAEAMFFPLNYPPDKKQEVIEAISYFLGDRLIQVAEARNERKGYCCVEFQLFTGAEPQFLSEEDEELMQEAYA
jgi:hypothetical protein